MPKRKTALIGACAAALLAVSACTSGGDEPSPPAGNNNEAPATSEQAKEATGKADVETPAAELRAGLTYLLTEHVYRAGIAVKTAVDKGGKMNDPTVKAAVASLDKNSVDLSKAVGSAYPDAEKPFLESWRQHIGFFVDYTLGKATKDNTMVKKAEKDLDGYRTSFGELINSVVPELPADAVAAELKPHVSSLFVAIDSVVAGDGKAFAKLRAAAEHMPMTAATLAGGIAKDKKLEGDPASGGAELRSGLTYLLTEHVDLAGITVVQAVSKGGDMKDPSVQAAVKALDANSVALSKAVGAAYPDAEKPFLESWRQHIGFFVDYTLGTATKDKAMVAKAKKDLDGYRTAFGELINSVVPELPADAVADELKPHVASLFAAIDSVVAGDGKAFAKLAKAAEHMPHTAVTLAGGIAENKTQG